jgi:hypothetical protein
LDNVDIFYDYLQYFTDIWDLFMTIWDILCSFGTLFPVLVSCTKKNLPSLVNRPLKLFAQLVPAILKCLDGKPEPQQDSLLLMMIPVLGLVNPPSEDPQVKQVLPRSRFTGNPFLSRQNYFFQILIRSWSQWNILLQQRSIKEHC